MWEAVISFSACSSGIYSRIVLNSMSQKITKYLKSKLILYSHDDFHMVQAVQSQVIDEVAVQSDLISTDLVKGFANSQDSGFYLVLRLDQLKTS